jgi:NAD(P)-dependent dehydrogenase (short-subunit alcohol dehydrogenase family)
VETDVNSNAERPVSYDRNRRFEGQVALVTGAATGIGLATARQLASGRAAVAIVDYNAEALVPAEASLREVSQRVLAIHADIGTAEAVDDVVAKVAQAFGDVDILVNNAAVSIVKMYVDHTEEDFDRQIQVNLMAPHRFTTRLLPSMMQRRRGSIVNIASVAGLHYTYPHVGYAASKGALIAFSRDVAFEAARFGVRVNCIAPGLIAVEKTKKALTFDSLDDSTGFRPMGWGRPQDVASVACFLASDEARFVIGTTIPVSGGTTLMTSMTATEAGAAIDEAVAAFNGATASA